jgi:adenylosuccinate synthase
MMDLTADRSDLAARLSVLHAHWEPIFRSRDARMPDERETLALCAGWGEVLGRYVRDTSRELEEQMRRGANVLLEGAQGTLLDVDHGTYPFVTSSNSCVLGAPAGAGLAPRRINAVLGITKAYTTRVGGGPFPTEQEGEVGDRLRVNGREFGSTTGRPRRCGWLDLAALRYAVRLNGVDFVAVTKLDVLTGLDEIRVCTGYRVGDETTDEIPLDRLDAAEPLYETLAGWDEEIAGVRDLRELPVACRKYLGRIESALGVPVHLVSVGPGRNETILVKNPFRE